MYIHFQVMQELKLLPLNSEMVEQKVNAFKSYSDEVRTEILDSNFIKILIFWSHFVILFHEFCTSMNFQVRRSLPDILLAVMNILLIQYKKTK